MATISSEELKKVWKYIHGLPRDLGFANKIDVEYLKHCSNLNMTEFDLRDILIEFEKRHFCHFPFSILHSQLLKS